MPWFILPEKNRKGPMLIEQIARDEMIPKKFLELILLDLKKAGILDSKRGKGGGILPAKITHRRKYG
jgi:DNA-binding IscR family transcriptional regulator